VLRRQDVAIGVVLGAVAALVFGEALAAIIAIAVLIVVATSLAARGLVARRRRTRARQLATTAKKSRL
jgi:UDP-N-acetylmuramyl pentapeptide phosphotransferase/UDP-N-acetylglucosamine-1-phosphate transferase